jgi:DnaD/phage-associated family protein
MARRRYVSTEISIDKEVNKLALQYGDFAALLFTWMIPHAEDDRTITADPYEILNKVVPARRDKTEEDVQEAIAGMIKHKLLTVVEDGKLLKFKKKSFYKYQSYIPVNKRQDGEEQKPPSSNPSGDEEKERTGKVFKFYQKNIGMITPFQSDVLIQYLDEGMEPEMIIAVMQDGIGKRIPWDWIKTVLANSDKNNIRTLAQYEAKKVEKARKEDSKGKPQNGKPQNNKPTFNNFKGRECNGKALEKWLLIKSRDDVSQEEKDKAYKELINSSKG